MKMQITRLVLLAAALAVVSASLVVIWRFDNDLQRARAHAAQGGVLLPTRCGPIEYQKSGSGVPLPARWQSTAFGSLRCPASATCARPRRPSFSRMPARQNGRSHDTANAFIIRSIPTDVLRACVCLVLDVLVARTRAAGGASICGDRAVIGGRLGVEPSGGDCDGLRQRHCGAAPLAGVVHAVARHQRVAGRSLGGLAPAALLQSRH